MQSSAVQKTLYPLVRLGAFRDDPKENMDVLENTLQKKLPQGLDSGLQRRYLNTVIQSTSLKCKQCGEEFTPIRDWHQFCSERCSAKARHIRYKARVKKALKLMKKNVHKRTA